VAFVVDENTLIRWSGSSWVDYFSGIALQNLSLLGINTTADATNKLAVKSSAVLFDNVGAGSQVKVNKAAAGDTASHLFQTGYSGRAEFGLTGDDDFHLKVSADGSTWKEGLKVDKTTGVVTFPNGAGETGSFTPTAGFDTTGDFSPTYNNQTGVYLRIGDLVWVSFQLDFDSNAYTTASGSFKISGLPFTAHNNTGLAYGGMAVGRMQRVTFGSSSFASIGIVPNTTIMRILISTSGVGGSIAGTTNIPASTTAIRIYGQGVYKKA
jgi:hypothetical protein